MSQTIVFDRDKCRFPTDFVWGTATAAYQVEGAAREDGRGESVWDVFCRTPGAVYQGHTGDVACDHYHRYAEDADLMRNLGVKAYRFSVSWSRVLPSGYGQVNEAGIAFYDRLVDALLERGIEPFCTLFHWDLPQALQRQGGFLNRDVAQHFADYAQLMGTRLGDRVKYWVTQNEPQCYIGFGVGTGMHAPGLKLPIVDRLHAAHNSLRAHGLAVPALRAAVSSAQVGYVLATQLCRPATSSAADLEAARQMTFAVRDRSLWTNTWWTDPVVFGRYPEDGLALFGADMPNFKDADMKDIQAPIDFLGLNIYRAESYSAGHDGTPVLVPERPGHPHSGVAWQPITPDAMYYGPMFFKERYDLPQWITENGLSTRDQVFLDGRVHDPQRIDFLHRCFLELRRAMEDGAPVKGYMLWSLLDNFEWHDGYSERFGIVYVDYHSLRRIPKDSYHWYKQVIQSQGESLAGEFALAPSVVTAD